MYRIIETNDKVSFSWTFDTIDDALDKLVALEGMYNSITHQYDFAIEGPIK